MECSSLFLGLRNEKEETRKQRRLWVAGGGADGLILIASRSVMLSD